MPYLAIPKPWDERLPDGRTALDPRRGANPTGVRVAFGDGGLSGVEPPKLEPYVAPPMGRLPENLDFHPYPENATPSQKIATDIQARRGAAPRSPVIEVPGGVNVEPPKPKGRGFLNTLKNIGKGFAINAAEYYRTHPDAGGLEMLTAGAAGAGVGGFNPGFIDRQIAERAIRGKEEELGREMGIEAGQAQLNKLIHPELKIPEDKEVGGRILRKQPDGSYKTIYEPPEKPAAAEKDVTLPDGRIVRKQADGTYKEVYKAPEKAEKPEKPDRVDVRQREERKRNYNAAEAELKSLAIEEEQIKAQKAAADKALSDLTSVPTKLKDGTPNPDLPLQKDVDAARDAVNGIQKQWEGIAEKKRAAQFKLDSNRDSTPQTLTIEGAIEAFKRKKGRAPNQQEIANMQAAIGQ